MAIITTIESVIGSLKSANETVKTMVNLRDTALFQGKAIELQAQILAAQGDALSAYETQTRLLSDIRELEEEIARTKTWNTEKQRYELKALNPGVFAYMLKPEARGSKPPHWVCANCYENGKVSVIQKTERATGRRVHGCPACKSILLAFTDPAWID